MEDLSTIVDIDTHTLKVHTFDGDHGFISRVH
jgi:hypothetical protein